MKIAIVAYEFPPRIGGMETYAFEIAKRFGESNNVSVICVVENKDENYYRNLGAKVSIFPFLTGVMPVDLETVADFIISEKPDIIHIMNAGFAVALKGIKVLGVPVVVSANGKDFLQPWLTQDKRAVILGLKAADRVVAVSEFVEERLEKLGVKNNVGVVHHGTDTLLFRPLKKDLNLAKKLGIPRKNKIILTVSRIAEKKNIEAVINIMPLLKYVTYLVVGPVGDKEYFEMLLNLADKLRVSDRIKFAGAVEYEKLPKYYNLADLYIMLSEERSKGDIESFGIAYLEALACGKPVVASRKTGVSFIISKNKAGMIVNPKNKKMIASAIRKLLGSKNKREWIKDKGIKLIKEEFNWDLSAGRIMKIYKDILKDRATN